MRRITALAAALVLCSAAPPLATAQPAPAPTPPACTASGIKLSFVCGVRNPEDLVQVPGSTWIIGSGLAVANQPGSGGLILIDPDKKTATRIAIDPTAKARIPFAAACPGPLDASKFSAHGLNILRQGRGKARLFVVGHGGREAIEIFDVISGKGPPTITWVGCVPTIADGQMNSVVGLPDGSIIATLFYRAPMTMGDALQGKNTGAVYIWKRAGVFEKIPATELPGANGVEVSPDGRYLFVAVTGTSSVMRYDLRSGAPPQVIKTDFRTDNIRYGPGDKLLLAGPGTDPNCKPAAGVRCLGTPVVAALDPATMKLTEVYRGPAEPGFQGLSSALIVGKTLWLGSYMADRAAYVGL